MLLAKTRENTDDPTSRLLVDSLADDVVEDSSVLEVRDLSLSIEAKDGLEGIDSSSLDLQIPIDCDPVSI